MIDNGEGPKPKTEDLTLHERDRLAGQYRSTFRHWQEKRISYNLPMELDENFALVNWGRPGLMSYDEPMCCFEYLSNFGSIRLNMWIVDKSKKIIIVSEDMYTLGPDGKTRGKGKQGMESIHRILQSITDATGYTIYDIATPNQKLAPLLSEAEGYSHFDTAQEQNISQSVAQHDRSRYERLMKSAKPYDSRIKQYNPTHTPISLSEKENQEIDTVLELAMVDRQRPLQT